MMTWPFGNKKDEDPKTPASSTDDEIFYQRAVQTAIWSLPVVNSISTYQSLNSLGAKYNDVIYFSKPMDSRHLFLTPNNQTPYTLSFIDLRYGPIVVEIPPANDKVSLFGSFNDTWSQPIEDFGPAGADQGNGGKYLLLPPDFSGKICEGGYIIRQSNTYFVTLGGRPIISKMGTAEDVVAVSKKVKIYPVSQSGKPAPNTYIDAYPKSWNALTDYDLSYFKKLSDFVNLEFLQERDAAMIGMLAAIGIEKGKKFSPDPKQIQLFEKAIHTAYAFMNNYFITLGKGYEKYWADRQWGFVHFTEKENFTFVVDNKMLLDERSGGFTFWAVSIPKKLGATSYMLGLRDKDGKVFDPKKTYRLTVPADVPVRDFWSVVVYSMKTKSFVPNPLERVGLSSYDKSKLAVNPDKTIDIYMSAKAPEGKESNWIPTKGEDFFLIFRLYGPEKPFFDKTWKLADVEEMK
ncbi:DUF1254 domain-containing protein [Methanolapillus ohkumae]